MDALRINLLLLLPCIAHVFDREVTVVKTIGKEPSSTPICTNETSKIIMEIMCTVRTGSNSSKECRLMYRDGGTFVHQCDSRFTLKKWNDTVFLHLTSLTAADRGNYTCECSNPNGTNILRLSITVRELFQNDNPTNDIWSIFEKVILPSALTAAVLLFIIVSVTVILIHRRYKHCSRERTEGSGSLHGSITPTDEDVVPVDDLYTSLQHPTTDIYQSVLFGHHQPEAYATSATNKVTDHMENLEVDSDSEIYENI